MKKLIRKLSRVSDSPQYALLQSESGRRNRHVPVPVGHVPVYVGEEMERFVVSAELLNHPIFISLLNRSAQEYGYEQKGVLRIPCHVIVFERVLEAIRLGRDSPQDILDLLAPSSQEFC
ncbi:hypothetical protein VNO78_06637 [Psophocarpus tetragonolobus]|uniref:Small auxin up regulated protein n=1 Tax=Psophocarpus tetragonolobus TaxID=3891 RepID=A0AAN9SVG5_PSOTE